MPSLAAFIQPATGSHAQIDSIVVTGAPLLRAQTTPVTKRTKPQPTESKRHRASPATPRYSQDEDKESPSWLRMQAKFGKLPMLPPYLQPGPHDFTDGSNFASGGAGVLETTNPGLSISLPTQLSYLKNVAKLLELKLGDLEAKRVLRTAVYLFSVGGVDDMVFYSTYPNATESLQSEFIANVNGNLTDVLKEIYNLGGRKIAFQNVGSLGCQPINRQSYGVTEGCVEGLLTLARLHNRALANALEELELKLSGFKYSIFNYYDALLDLYHNPAKHGFTNGSDACCGIGPYRGDDCGGDNGTEPFELCPNPGDNVWWDGGHSTERANLKLAELIWSGTLNTTGPYNVKQFFQQV